MGTTEQTTVPLSSLGLNDLAKASPLRATESMPAEIAELLKPDSGLYVRSKTNPKIDFGAERVPGSDDMWRVSGTGELRTTLTGLKQTELQPERKADKPDVRDVGTDGYRPPWVEQQFLPRLVPFSVEPRESGLRESRIYMEPRVHEAERLPYPWCTIGRVITRSSLGAWSGSGMLVGPNLVLTAGHVAPWGGANWSMEFIPALREGDANPRPFGSSFTEQYRGYNPRGSVTGYDYVVCKLFNPLGRALGWMGTQWWGDEDKYTVRDYISSGYPATFGGRPAVQFGMGIRDIDSDSPGIELECVEYTTGGWSGGPLWYFNGTNPTAVGVLSGAEKDVLDPRWDVYAGWRAMVDLVKFGLDNWRP